MSKSHKDTFDPSHIPTLGTEEYCDLMGDIKINHSVIASIVRLAALEVEGVHAINGSFVDGITELFSKKESDRGVKVLEDESGSYIIDIRVIMTFGVELAKVAVQVQENIRKMVPAMTMKNVAKVNVIIEGVKMKSNKIPDTTSNHQSED